MKVGKTVWVFQGGKPIPMKIKVFGKGLTAELEYPEGHKLAGKTATIYKLSLYAKKPAGYES